MRQIRYWRRGLERNQNMTKKQRQYCYDIEKEIREQPGGEHYRIYVLISIVRIQDNHDETNYRMFIPCKGDGKKAIRLTMMKLFREMSKEGSK